MGQITPPKQVDPQQPRLAPKPKPQKKERRVRQVSTRLKDFQVNLPKPSSSSSAAATTVSASSSTTATDPSAPPPPKRSRGRPRKYPLSTQKEDVNPPGQQPPPPPPPPPLSTPQQQQHERAVNRSISVLTKEKRPSAIAKRPNWLTAMRFQSMRDHQFASSSFSSSSTTQDLFVAADRRDYEQLSRSQLIQTCIDLQERLTREWHRRSELETRLYVIESSASSSK